MALVIENGRVLQKNNTFREQSVAIDGKVVSALDGREKIRKSHKRYDRIDATDCLVLPGFINAHTHAAMGLARGLGVGMPLFEMFEKVLFPLEKKMKDEHAYLGAMVSALEFIRTGTTSVNNINARWPKQVLKAFDKMGLRGTMALALKDRSVASGETFECKALAENEWLVKRLREHDLLKGMFGLANEVEATESLIKDVKALADEHGTGIHMHVAESIDEKGFILQKTGKTSVRYLYDLGVLNENSLAVHAVNVTKKDIMVLAKSRASVVHCPTANLNLNSGVSPVSEMLLAGVSMSIGVDDPIANMSNDIRGELMNAMILQKTAGSVLTPQQLLSMALNSRLYGYSTGSISPGSLADVIVISLKDKAVPSDNDSLLRESIMSGSPVIHSVINGTVAMRDGKVSGINERNILKKARNAMHF